MSETLRPANESELCQAITAARDGGAALELVGGGTKRSFGRPVAAARRLDLVALSGITLYEPAELVLTARAGTPLADVESALAGHGQMLAFEPPDLGPLYGAAPGGATLGGIVACNLAGPRRIRAGAARDHVLGLRAVTGRGEAVKTGGRVVKNVTGYDLCKLLTGSFGTLAALSEITLKVLPAGEKTRTLLIMGLDPVQALAAMTQALCSANDVSAAAYLPAAIALRSAVDRVAQPGVTVVALRIEGPAPSVAARDTVLRSLLADFGPMEELNFHNSRRLWAAIGAGVPFARHGGAVWRLSVPPASGAMVAAALDRAGAEWYMDWGGGLLWAHVPDAGGAAAQDEIRAAFAGCGGHATLLRAPDAVRAGVSVFQPPSDAVAALNARIKDAFDPARILNPGRMYRGI